MNRKIKHSASVAAIVAIGLLFSPALIADEIDDAYSRGYYDGLADGYLTGLVACGSSPLKGGQGKYKYEQIGIFYRGKSGERQPFEFVGSTNNQYFIQSGRSTEFPKSKVKTNLNSNFLNSYLDSVITCTKNISINHPYSEMNILVFPDTTD